MNLNKEVFKAVRGKSNKIKDFEFKKTYIPKLRETILKVIVFKKNGKTETFITYLKGNHEKDTKEKIILKLKKLGRKIKIV